MEARAFPPIGECVAAMPLHLYPNIRASGSVPANWRAARGNADKFPVYNAQLLKYLRALLGGKWQKVMKYGNSGEVHYFEHESGQVAGVKFFPNE
jgi:hypothetical protein